MQSRISATDAVRNFSDLLNRVRYRGEEFIIERGGEAVCQIVAAQPVKRTLVDLARILDSSAKPDAEYWNTVEKVTRSQPKIPKSPWRR